MAIRSHSMAQWGREETLHPRKRISCHGALSVARIYPPFYDTAATPH